MYQLETYTINKTKTNPLTNKRSLHVRSQGLKISTLIGENRKIEITHHYHYNKNWPKIPCA